ncbi:MAG: hypothetical protein C4570_08915 [Ammonifex sp.]|nr:MAG: hypothetical protein C4570_08915 [Ammonifex sp.]
MFLSFKTRKRFIKAVFWVLVVALGVGLVGSSVIWTSLPDEPVQETPENQDNPVASQMEKAEKQKDIAALLSIAGRCAESGDVQNAVRAYQKILNVAPENSAARLGLVEQYFMADNYPEALLQVEAILKKAPDHQKALYYRGLIRAYGSEDYPGAVADLKRFVSLAKTGREVEEARDLIREWSAKTKN